MRRARIRFAVPAESFRRGFTIVQLSDLHVEMSVLDPEALPRVPPPDTLLKDCQNILVRHGLR